MCGYTSKHCVCFRRDHVHSIQAYMPGGASPDMFENHQVDIDMELRTNHAHAQVAELSTVANLHVGMPCMTFTL